MITYQQERPVMVSGRTITAIARTRVSTHLTRGGFLITVDKQPLASVCRGTGEDEIIGIDGCKIDEAALKNLMAEEGC